MFLYFFAFIGVLVTAMAFTEVVFNFWYWLRLLKGEPYMSIIKKVAVWVAVALLIIGMLVAVANTPCAQGEELYRIEDDPGFQNPQGPVTIYIPNKVGYKPISGKIRENGVWRWMDADELKAIHEDKPLPTRRPARYWKMVARSMFWCR